MNVARSWYFAAPAADLAISGLAHESIVADRPLRLWRRPDGDVEGTLGGEAVPVRERSGLVFVWLGGGAPGFEIPGFAQDGWTALTFRHVDLATEPRTIMQDLADLPHFQAVHRYTGIQVVEPLSLTGPSLRLHVAFGWDTGVPRLALPMSFVAEVWGLGYQRTEVRGIGGLAHTRHLVMPTPQRPGVTRVHLGLSTHRGARRLGNRAAGRALHWFTDHAFQRDIRRDAELWVGQAAHTPTDDGPIVAYRAWADQF